jgi:excinuclease ABC subunit C
MANKNARHTFHNDRDKQRSTEGILEGLQQKLRLKHLPQRIECFDISNIMGTQAVGSMVTFQDGKPDKARYRRFKIKTVQGADDYAMMTEVLTRRYKRALEEDDLPDLIMVDGGKGQLNIALSVLWELGIEEPDLVSIAKSRVQGNWKGQIVERTEERIFLPGRKNPVTFPPHSPQILLLQQVRDEAHRFAVSYHKQLRLKESFRSPLDAIPGIGEKRKQQLLTHFGSLKKIQEASLEELARVEGLTRPVAEKVFAIFHRKKGSTPG